MELIRSIFKKILNTQWQTWCVAAFLLLFLIMHGVLVNQTFRVDTAGGIHTVKEAYGDIPLHMTQIAAFAFSPSLFIGEPIYYGTRLAYPFEINLISGLLLRMTNSWTFSVMMPIYFFVAANLLMVYMLYRKFFEKRYLVCFSILIFFLGMGLGGYVLSQTSTLTTMTAEYPSQNIAMGAPLMLAYLYQRTSFIGLALLLALLLVVRKVLNSTSSKYHLILGGIFIGLMPLAQAHSFIAASVFLLVGMIFSWKDRTILKKLFIIAGIGAVIAVPQILFLLGSKQAIGVDTDFIKFRLGWMIDSAYSSVVFPNGAERSIFSWEFIKFNFINFGFLFVAYVASALYFLIKKIKDTKEILIYAITAVVVFIIVQLVQLQPWDYDNNKLLVYVQFFAAPFIVYAVARFFKDSPIKTFVVSSSVTLLIVFSGIVHLIPRLTTPTSYTAAIFSVEDIRFAEFIKTLPTDKLILTSTRPQNVVDSLAGRPVLVGYSGWLWTRGINYRTRETVVIDFYKNPTKDSQLFKDFPIGFIVVDDFTRREYGAKDAAFDRLFTKLFQGGSSIVYSIQK